MTREQIIFTSLYTARESLQDIRQQLEEPLDPKDAQILMKETDELLSKIMDIRDRIYKTVLDAVESNLSNIKTLVDEKVNAKAGEETSKQISHKSSKTGIIGPTFEKSKPIEGGEIVSGRELSGEEGSGPSLEQ